MKSKSFRGVENMKQLKEVLRIVEKDFDNVRFLNLDSNLNPMFEGEDTNNDIGKVMIIVTDEEIMVKPFDSGDDEWLYYQPTP